MDRGGYMIAFDKIDYNLNVCYRPKLQYCWTTCRMPCPGCFYITPVRCMPDVMSL